MATADPDHPNAPEHRPRLEPTRPATLVVAALVTAALAWLLISNFYNDMPTLPWLPPLTLLGLAIVEAVMAYTTKARIDRRAGAPPVDPLLVARYVVLAKASALAAALFGGLYLGLTGWLLAQRGFLAEAANDLPQSVVGLVGSAALVAAALWLERACRVPPPPPGADRVGPGRFDAGTGPDDRVEDDRATG